MQSHKNYRETLPLVAIVGPTGVGKSEIAIQLALRLNGEIVSADSRLFYRGMDIGTAKPSLDDRQRVPHHLIDVAAPDEIWSLALFQERARQALLGISNRGRLPFLVGGTGQYLRAVIQGWDLPKVQPRPQLRQALEAWAGETGREGLHRRLAALDPIAAGGIDFRNLRRTIRALEVIFSTGKRFSDQRQQGVGLYRLCLIGLNRPRQDLYARIDARIEAMLRAGFLDEVRGLMDRGYSPDLPSFSAIGYREISAYLSGKMTLDEAITAIKRHTRIYVRRQANWFKAQDPEIHWFQIPAQTIDQIEATIREWLGV